LTACAPQPRPSPPGESIAAAPAVQADASAFQAWLAATRAEAARKGISEATLAAALDSVIPIPRVVELDRRQPEFTQTFWRYLDGAVSDTRVKDGVARQGENRALLTSLEKKYGVPSRILTAFWGLETNYGRNLGTYKVPAALATLAYDGRRSAFFRGELFDALSIIDRGHISPDKMIGSWAGAMGQTQFMPSTFLRHAVDETGDGHIDVWGQTPDALGSGANYLKNLGWDGARTWGREVRLPKSFDLTQASLDGGAADTLKPLSAWAALGIVRADGVALPKQDIAAALILPAGVEGPAFLVYDNFRIILKWNRSIFYALAVGHLSDRISGGPALAGMRVNEEPLSREQVLKLQAVLKGLGHLNGEPDGTVGSNTRRAMRQYQLTCGLPPDGFVGQKAVRILAGAADMAAPCRPLAQGVAIRDSGR
jgi:membrane-bound lytic murein transglycosylase B